MSRSIIGGVSVPGYTGPVSANNPLNPFVKMTQKERWESATGTSINDMDRIIAAQNGSANNAYDKWANSVMGGTGLVLAGGAALTVIIVSFVL